MNLVYDQESTNQHWALAPWVSHAPERRIIPLAEAERQYGPKHFDNIRAQTCRKCGWPILAVEFYGTQQKAACARCTPEPVHSESKDIRDWNKWIKKQPPAE